MHFARRMKMNHKIFSFLRREVASGMNDNRAEFWKMLQSNPTIIVVENKDRLTRFGFNYLRRLLEKQNCKIEVINQDHEDEKDLIKDLVSIITSFCCRLYGIRRGQNKSKKIQEVLDDNN
jgi:predicted site-specific integrase-resolvase